MRAKGSEAQTRAAGPFSAELSREALLFMRQAAHWHQLVDLKPGAPGALLLHLTHCL